MTTSQPYTEIGTIAPAWEPVRYGDDKLPLSATDDEILRWANAVGAPPAVGTKVMVRYNNIGPATVVGYFTEGGYLGLLLDLDIPTKNGARAHAFGTEWFPAEHRFVKASVRKEGAQGNWRDKIFAATVSVQGSHDYLARELIAAIREHGYETNHIVSHSVKRDCL